MEVSEIKAIINKEQAYSLAIICTSFNYLMRIAYQLAQYHKDSEAEYRLKTLRGFVDGFKASYDDFICSEDHFDDFIFFSDFQYELEELLDDVIAQTYFDESFHAHVTVFQTRKIWKTYHSMKETGNWFMIRELQKRFYDVFGEYHFCSIDVDGDGLKLGVTGDCTINEIRLYAVVFQYLESEGYLDKKAVTYG